MFKVFFLIHRNPQLSGGAFLAHWSEVHGPLLVATPDVNRHFLRYAQNRPAERDAGNFVYDGVAVTWLRALGDLAMAAGEPAFEPLWRDGTFLLDRSRSTVVAMRPQGPEPESCGSAKVMMFLRRRAGMDAAEFQERMGQMAAATFAGEAFVLNLPELLSTTRFGEGELDAIVELSFANLDEAVAFASGRAKGVFDAALSDIIDTRASSFAALEERVVFPETVQAAS